MIDYNTIFHGSSMLGSTDITELLMALVSPDNSIDEKRKVWDMWQHSYYNPDDVISFFGDSLFNETDSTTYLKVICGTEDYHNFYELAMSLDVANIDPRAYYLFWILNYGHKAYTQIVKDALDYDPDTIHTIFPQIEEVLGVEH